MRKLRIAAPVQPTLDLPGEGSKPKWWTLPEQTRQYVLCLLARLIARSVVEEQESGDE